jgi:hypothetical protein
VDERRREVQPPLHTARVVLDATVGRVLELDEGEQLVRAGRRRVGSDAEQPSLEDQQLPPALPRVQAGLLQRDADPMPHSVRVAGHVDAGDECGARGDREQRREHPHGGRLARAVGSEEAEDLTGLDRQIDAPNRLDRPGPALVVLHEPLGPHGGTPRPFGSWSLLVHHACHVFHVLCSSGFGALWG